MTKIFSLNSSFYGLDSIQEAINVYSEYANIEILDDKFTLSVKDTEYDIDEIIDEFSNYVLSVEKKRIKNSQKEEINLENSKKIDFKEGFKFNFYRVGKIGEKILITTDSGSWIFLDENEYELLKNRNIEKGSLLFDKLKKENIIIDNENLFSEIKNYKNKKNFLFQGPSLHIIVLNLNCNIRCLYCHASSVPLNKPGKMLSEENATKVVDLIFETPSNQITIEFQGGEPLLNFEILKYIVHYANEKNKVFQKDLRFALVTNLVFMDEEKLSFLTENKVSICTSLDGPKEVHNKNRQEYDKSIKWIKKIQELSIKNEIPFKINALLTITRHSLDKGKDIVDEYVGLGLEEIWLRNLNFLGYAKKNSDTISYTFEEFEKFWKDTLNYIIELNKKGVKIREKKVMILLQKLFDEFDPNYTELRSPCGAVTGQILYNYDGNIFTCDEGRMLKDDVFMIGKVGDSYTQITTNPTSCSIIASSINDVQYCSKCVFKPFCGTCPVMNYSEQGSLIANIPSTSWCKIHMMQFNYLFELIQDPEIKKILKDWILNSNQSFGS